MYSENLDKLIELALADGVLTDIEKQVLFRKAEAEGIQHDEFEMVLEGKLQLRQKEGAYSKQKDNVIKCPSCNDIIPALSKVCSSCGFVIDSGKKSSESEKGLEDLISDIEDTLVEIKSIKQPNAFTTLWDHSYISLPILSLIVLAIGFQLNNDLRFLGLILAVISWRVIKKKIREAGIQNAQPTFNNLKATFEKHFRNAKTLFGENKKVKLSLDELDNELRGIEAKRKKGKIIAYFFYGFITLIGLSTFFILQTGSQFENDSETKNAESPLVIKAESLIEENKIDEANQVISKIKSADNIVLIRSKIQLHKLTKEMDALEPLLADKKYSEIKFGLSKVIWQKISTDVHTNITDINAESLERDVYKTFLERKKAINEQLPKKFQVKIEDENSF